MRDALSAADAMLYLPVRFKCPVVFDEEFASCLPIFLRLFVLHNRSFVDTFIIKLKVLRDVDAERTRHAVLAAGARDDRIFEIKVSDFHKQRHLFVGARLKWAVGP